MENPNQPTHKNLFRVRYPNGTIELIAAPSEQEIVKHKGLQAVQGYVIEFLGVVSIYNAWQSEATIKAREEFRETNKRHAYNMAYQAGRRSTRWFHTSI